MKKSYLELKIVTTDLQELERLIKTYEELGFISDKYSQEENGIYWTFLRINNGLVEEKTENLTRLESGKLIPSTEVQMCCEFGEAKNNGSCNNSKVKDYVRTDNDCDGSNWDNEPICLCEEHSIGHIPYHKN